MVVITRKQAWQHVTAVLLLRTKGYSIDTCVCAAGAGEDDGDTLSAASVTTPLDGAQAPLLRVSPPPSIAAVPHQAHLNGGAANGGAKRAKPHHKQGHANGKASPKGGA